MTKLFLENINTELFEVWDRLPWIQGTEEVLGKFCVVATTTWSSLRKVSLNQLLL